MFRFNNPDALLVLLLVGGAYASTRALERRPHPLAAAACALVGFGFLAKMLQAFLVVPAFALVYLLAAPPRLRRGSASSSAAGSRWSSSAGWWVAIVELWPGAPAVHRRLAEQQHLDLIFGYNGFGRLTGNETGSVGGGGGRRGAASGARPAGTAVQRRDRAARSRGCCRRR